ncbi:MAG: hypothetical protein EXS10_04950 [Phycisphaerales bacterium]|nr:hypothetical protein [Phycisphaerales bacterium]
MQQARFVNPKILCTRLLADATPMKTHSITALLALPLALVASSAMAVSSIAPPKGGNAKTRITQAAAPKADAPLTIPGLTHFTTVQLNVPAGIPEVAEITVNLQGQQETLRLYRTSLRSVNAKLLLDEGTGALREVPLPPARTYRGTLASNLDVRIAASVIDGKLWAMIDAVEGTWFIQPASDFSATASANSHVIYRHDQVLPLSGGCGNDNANLALPDWLTEGFNPGADGDPALEGASGAGDGGIAGATPFIAEIAFDADYEFFQKNSNSATNTVNDIENVMNNVSLVYDRDVNITYEYTTFVVRTTATDPYTTSVMTDLLCEFRQKWITAPEVGIQRDVAQLFTGKTITGSVIGLAWLGVTCNQVGSDCSGNGNLAFSAVESRFTTIADYRTSLSAHEVGHNWQAGHCDGASPCNIMCSLINSCNGTTGANLKFSPTSIAQIVAYRDAVACDTAMTAPQSLPFLDQMNNTTIDPTKWNYIDGGQTSPSATNEPSASRSLNLDSTGAGEYDDDEIRSNIILLSGITAPVVLSYYTEYVTVEAGETLTVEYFNNANDWVVLNTITSVGGTQTTFTRYEHTLPAAAKHNKFRLRFRTNGDTFDDEWFIDDIQIIAGTPPANDECSSAIVLMTDGLVSFNSTYATNSALSLPVSCDQGFGTVVANDVWYAYIPTCTGTLTVATCGLTAFDTRIAAYSAQCPPSGALVGCSDNGAGCPNGTSSMSLAATIGLPLYVRVGGATGGGAGMINFVCVPTPPACQGDVDVNGVVDGADLTIVLNGWGTASGDLDGNGIVDAADITLILNAWGPC